MYVIRAGNSNRGNAYGARRESVCGKRWKRGGRLRGVGEYKGVVFFSLGELDWCGLIASQRSVYFLPSMMHRSGEGFQSCCVGVCVGVHCAVCMQCKYSYISYPHQK